MHRFFLTDQDEVGEKFITIKNHELIHQISRVLRFKLLHKIILIRNEEEIRGQIIRIKKTSVKVSILEKGVKEGVGGRLILAQSLLKKAGNFELVLQKGTELGVTEFIPLITERCEYKGRPRMERWAKITKEAAEQCGRVDIPKIQEPKKLKELKEEGVQIIMPHTKEGASVKEINLEEEVIICIGPEGGFTEREIEVTQGILVKTGERVMRSETAGIVMTALIQAKREEW